MIVVSGVLEFASVGRRVEGNLDAKSLPRIGPLLVGEPAGNGDGVIAYEAAGFMRDDGHPAIRLRVSGRLMLACGVCLEACEWAFESERELVFMPQDLAGAFEDDPEDISDVLPLEGQLDLEELVEDEVLLSMPMAHAHAPGGCPDGARTAVPKGPGAFGVLAGLKQH